MRKDRIIQQRVLRRLVKMPYGDLEPDLMEERFLHPDTCVAVSDEVAIFG